MKPFDHPIHPETLLENAGWMKALARSLVASVAANDPAESAREAAAR